MPSNFLYLTGDTGLKPSYPLPPDKELEKRRDLFDFFVLCDGADDAWKNIEKQFTFDREVTYCEFLDIYSSIMREFWDGG